MIVISVWGKAERSLMVRLWGFLYAMGEENGKYFSNSRGKGFKTRSTWGDKDFNAMGCRQEEFSIEEWKERKKERVNVCKKERERGEGEGRKKNPAW